MEQSFPVDQISRNVLFLLQFDFVTEPFDAETEKAVKFTEETLLS